jgi:hypothetical protein
MANFQEDSPIETWLKVVAETVKSKGNIANYGGVYHERMYEASLLITELRTKLAQAEAALKVKDEFIEPLTHVAGKEVNGNKLHRLAIEAIAMQPSKEALDEYVMSRLEVASLFIEIEGQETQPPLYRLKDK